MAIDVSQEKLVSVHDAAKLIPPYRRDEDGNPIPTHPTRLIRAIIDGTLDGVYLGGQWLTSVEAIQRWVELSTATRLARLQGKHPEPATPLAGRTPMQRKRAADKAKKHLEGMGAL